MDIRLRLAFTIVFGLSVGLNVGLAMLTENALDANRDLRRAAASEPVAVRSADQTAVLGQVRGVAAGGELVRLEAGLEHVWATSQTDLEYAIVQVVTPTQLVSLSPETGLRIETVHDEDGSTRTEAPRLNADDQVLLVVELDPTGLQLAPESAVEIAFLPVASQPSSRVFVTPFEYPAGPLRLA